MKREEKLTGYYRKFDTRETEIKKNKWGLMLRKINKEKNSEGELNEEKVTEKMGENEEIRIIEDLIEAILHKLKEIKEKGKRGKIRDPNSMQIEELLDVNKEGGSSVEVGLN